MNDKDDKDDKDGKDDKDDKNNKDGSSAKPTNTSSKKNNNFKKKEKIYSAEYEKKEKERVKFRNKKKIWLNYAVLWDKYYFSEDYKYSKAPLSRLQKYHYRFKARPYIPNRLNRLMPDVMPYKRK